MGQLMELNQPGWSVFFVHGKLVIVYKYNLIPKLWMSVFLCSRSLERKMYTNTVDQFFSKLVFIYIILEFSLLTKYKIELECVKIFFFFQSLSRAWKMFRMQSFTYIFGKILDNIHMLPYVRNARITPIWLDFYFYITPFLMKFLL